MTGVAMQQTQASLQKVDRPKETKGKSDYSTCSVELK
jgi:hypothetical protein